MSHRLNKDAYRETVLRQIYLAQVASDGGKRIYSLPDISKNNRASRLGYGLKDQYILKAMKLIDAVKCGIGYDLVIDESIDSSLIYFKISGMNACQVSFHSFSRELIKRAHGKNARQLPQHWQYAQFNSRENALRLLEIIER